MRGKPQQHKHTNPLYRKAILKAIEDLHDCHLRSNVDSIRRHVMSALEESDQHSWNEIVFLKTLKSIVQVGEVEQQTFVNCALSPEYKRRRADSFSAFVEQNKGQGPFPFIPETDPPPTTSTTHHFQTLLLDSPKQAPKRKVEHDKYKIIPKPLFDRTLLKNPMDTDTL